MEKTCWQQLRIATLQSIIALSQNFDQKKFNKLPKVWQQQYNELRLDENNFIYIDERLVIPEELRRPIFRSLHWGHPGRDTMLTAVPDIWWPRIRREIVLLAQSCSQCQKAGKNLKSVQKQSEYGKLPAVDTHNDEIAIDFAGPFKIAPKAKKYLLVTIDHKTNWPNDAFVKKTNGRNGSKIFERTYSSIRYSKKNKNRPSNHIPRRDV